jgi:hypothetical protein
VNHRAHGARNPTWVVWRDMVARCTKPGRREYARYGGNGIKVCERWLGPHGFQNFVSDMGHRPSSAFSIDRLRNSEGYKPSNCRWATMKEQAVNKRNNRRLVFRGQTKTQSQWATEVGLTQQRIHQRLAAGWSVERALTAPIKGAS